MPKKKSAPNKEPDKPIRITTPGLKHILDEEVPLAAQVLQGNKYNHILIRGKPRIGKSYIRDKILEELEGVGFEYKDIVNCTAMPKELLDSALFGHKKNSFTGATTDRIGLLDDEENKDKKQVVILEEIGELPPSVQAKLLVFLDNGLVHPIGVEWGKPIESTVRIIATTNVEDEKLRVDFKERFWEVVVPPLYERRFDIPILIKHFLENSKIELSALELATLTAYNWPGGVSEIEKMCMRLKSKQEFFRISPVDDTLMYFWFTLYSIDNDKAKKINQLFPLICSRRKSFKLDDFDKEFYDFWKFFGQSPFDAKSLFDNMKQFKKTAHYNSADKGYFWSKSFQNNLEILELMHFAQDYLYDKEFMSKAKTKYNNSDPSEDLKDVNENGIVSLEQTEEELLKKYWMYHIEVKDRKGKDLEEITGVSKTAISKTRKSKYVAK